MLLAVFPVNLRIHLLLRIDLCINFISIILEPYLGLEDIVDFSLSGYISCTVLPTV